VYFVEAPVTYRLQGPANSN